MLQNLFSSKVRVEILSVLFLAHDKDLYVREIERLTGQNRQNIIRELRNLEGIGLLIGRRQGNLKYYSLNKDFLIYNELKSIFLKTRGAVAVIKDALSGESDIDFAFIYGSFAIGSEKETSDVDVMVIGNILLENLLKILREPETTLARDVNLSLCKPAKLRSGTAKMIPL